MKAMPQLTSRVPIQKNLSFPRPDKGYTTLVRHHGRCIKRRTFRIYRTVIILLFYIAAFLLGFTNFVFAEAMTMFSNKPQVTPKFFQIFFAPLHVTSILQPQLPSDSIQ